ncbi:hypothetical protein SUGI_1042450 [Cryptomeria japonica]|uniref:uncharacterized protein LOC131038553 n=1 Tax=Cryptomeria japonica TaxID=3369 RepID=UPI002414C289|nr:uncharacterized protein LOC131038553 [Cryptomeria japonica]GLJ49315.1 hypothetical protein SUGI_1042450 [Cryptomeria japonica]
MASVVCFNSIPQANVYSSYLHGHGHLVPSCCSKSPIRIGTPRGMGGKVHRSLKATNSLQRIVETPRDEGAAPAHEWGNKNTSSFIIIPVWALLTSPPALALTKYTDQEWVQIAITSAIVLFAYIIVVPLIIFNYLRLRWFKRNLPETIFQFLLVFLFFPGMLLLAPFINFRPFPKDPTMKEPWS